MRVSSIVLAVQRRAVLFSAVAFVIVAGGTAAVLVSRRPAAHVATTRLLFPAGAAPAGLTVEARAEFLAGPDVAREAVALLQQGPEGARHAALAPEQLRNAVDVRLDPATAIAVVTARHADAATALDYVRAYPAALQKRLEALLDGKPREQRVRQIESQADERRADVKVAQARLRRYLEGQRRHPGDVRAIDEKIYQLTQSFQQRADRGQDLQRERDLLLLRLERKPTELRGEFPPSPKVAALDVQIAAREAELATLPPDGDTPRQAAAALADLRALLASERRAYEADQIVQLRARDRATVAALERELTLLAEQREGLEAELKAVADHKERVLGHQRDVAQATAAFDAVRRELAAAQQDLQSAEWRQPHFVVVEKAASVPAGRAPLPAWLIPASIAAGLALGAAAAWTAERFNDRLRTPSDVRRYVHLPLLGSIPEVREGAPHVAQLAPRDTLTELWNRAGTVVGALADRHGARAILVTSVVEREGKSTAAANLAVTLARMGRRVVLADADLRRPSLHSVFKLDNGVGLSSFLTGKLAQRMLLEDIRRRIDVEETGLPEAAPEGPVDFREPPAADEPAPAEGGDAEDLRPGDIRALGEAAAEPAPAAPPAVAVPARRPVEVPGFDQILLKTDIENLWVVPAGPPPTNPAALVRHPSLRGVVEHLKARADVVIVDSPPLAGAADALALSASADACILVVGADAVTRQQVRWAKTLLDDVGARHLGVLLNRVMLPDRGYAYYFDGGKQYREG